VVAAIMLLTLDRETSTTDQIIFIDLLCSLSLSFALSPLHGFPEKQTQSKGKALSWKPNQIFL
jgi:hypothetical protein